MKSLFLKLSFILAALAVWMAYEHRDRLQGLMASGPGRFLPATFPGIESAPPRATRVYVWKDASGRRQFSDEKPMGVPEAEIRIYRSDQNVLSWAGPKRPGSPDTPGARAPAGIAGSVSKTLREARDLEGVLQDRRQEMDRRLEH